MVIQENDNLFTLFKQFNCILSIFTIARKRHVLLNTMMRPNYFDKNFNLFYSQIFLNFIE